MKVCEGQVQGLGWGDDDVASPHSFLVGVVWVYALHCLPQPPLLSVVPVDPPI